MILYAGGSFNKYSTCTFPPHGIWAWPGKNIKCFNCEETGHFRGSKSCKKDTKKEV